MEYPLDREEMPDTSSRPGGQFMAPLPDAGYVGVDVHLFTASALFAFIAFCFHSLDNYFFGAMIGMF